MTFDSSRDNCGGRVGWGPLCLTFPLGRGLVSLGNKCHLLPDESFYGVTSVGLAWPGRGRCRECPPCPYPPPHCPHP